MLTPRYYQLDACAGTAARLEEGCRSPLIILPTGAGKTVTVCEHMNRTRQKGRGRHMFLAHRQELITQARDAIERNCEVTVGIEKAEQSTAKEDVMIPAQAVVTTPQTQLATDGARMQQFAPADFSLLTVDEAHHYARKSTWTNVLDYYMENPDLHVVGLTATPNRADEQALGKVFDSVAFAWDFVDAKNDGWLVPVKARPVHIDGIDLRKIGRKGKKGDFKDGEVDAIMKRDEVLFGIAALMRDHLEPKRTLCFCTGVEAAESLCMLRQKDGAKAAWVSGKTPKGERRDIIHQFNTGEITEVYNCGVLTEGFDNPLIERILQARPTLSESLARQMIGRGTRTLPGLLDDIQDREQVQTRIDAIRESAKPHLEVIDLVGLTAQEMEPITAARALAGNWDDDVVEKAEAMMLEQGEAIDLDTALVVAAEALEEDKRIDALYAAAAKKEADDNRRELYQRVSYSVRARIVDGETPVQRAERLMQATHIRERGFYHGRRPSDPQVIKLKRLGLPVDKNTTFAWAYKMIGVAEQRRAKGLSSFKQIRALEDNGVDASRMTFEEAHQRLSQIWGTDRNPTS
tara:strand:+ start:2762 stop:4489 length:1728 start_codon:yes stop_codon:yes gene_type:complete